MDLVVFTLMLVCIVQAALIVRLVVVLRAKKRRLRAPSCVACADSGYADYAAVPCEACGGASRSR